MPTSKEGKKIKRRGEMVERARVNVEMPVDLIERIRERSRSEDRPIRSVVISAVEFYLTVMENVDEEGNLIDPRGIQPIIMSDAMKEMEAKINKLSERFDRINARIKKLTEVNE